MSEPAPVIVHCLRCAVPLRIGPPPAAGADFIVRSQTGRGYCPNCMATRFFKSPVLAAARAQVLERGHTVQDALRLPHIQECFGRVLAAGHAELKLEEIDWLEVIANWDLPFPNGDEDQPMTLWG